MRLRSHNTHPLVWPFYLATLAYGLGFTVFAGTAAVAKSSLFTAMTVVHPVSPILWGMLALTALVLTHIGTVNDITHLRKGAAMAGAMVWIAAMLCYVLTANWLVLFSVAIPNLIFWILTYLGRTSP